jgi:hypothetical protein
MMYRNKCNNIFLLYENEMRLLVSQVILESFIGPGDTEHDFV